MTAQRSNCQYCGRFVSDADAHVVYDDYAGGYEADPYCPPGRGCRAPEQENQ